ncbi:centrosomal protein of 44 kDa isoform X1 [Zootoca vivipara]|uniref:centrosomal protein of 44 kDa isoform X1 n=1 Tax=Zootoca vivipara TaxID=8524 RepID=UPI00293BA7F0|nr:centrosomal protein of 44 kDa isoform X1 [Zootoca vivipara]XP_034969960.2 centrosomal protein of 44 kDa isoform X1 [Zootoca vivipara]
MATGDLKGNLRKIEQGLRLLNYPRDVNYAGLAKGDPSAFLPIISYCFTSFSTYIAELLVESDVKLMAKNDLRFVDAVYKVLRDQFQYKPVLSKQQFLQYGFAERKIQIVCDIINSVYKRHKELSNMNKVKSQTRKRTHPVKPQLQANSPSVPDSTMFCATNPFSTLSDSATISTMDFQQNPQIEHHKSMLSARLPQDIINEALEEEEEEQEEQDEIVCIADGPDSVYERVLEENSNEMQELKSQLDELQEKLNKLDWVEEKLQALEDKLQGKVVIDEKEWNNLLSRLLLLETQLLLQSKKADLSADFNNVSEENTSSRNMTPVSPDREKAELPETLHQSSGYSSQLSADPSPKATAVNNHGLSEVSKETTVQRMERISKIIEETSELLKTSRNTS